MHILICNERFLFRFGLDRALIILGKGLKNFGHTISIIANKYDREVLESFADNIINIPEAPQDYLNANEHTERWLKDNWNEWFDDSNKPDIALIGGWPFFSSIPLFRKMGVHAVFFDCGAVPLEGYSNGLLITQQKLRELRKKYLREATAIIAISDFIADTQSKVDTNYNVPIFKVLLGADHLDFKIWQKSDTQTKSKIIASFESVKNNGKRCILNLGRWEPDCYKNSEAVFDVMRKITVEAPNCVLFILSDPSTVYIPPDLQNVIFPIGYPDDTELSYLMENVDLGISTSLWEGFNLPLAEMQWLNSPVLVLNKGAHPEVVIHPWYLCNDNGEMAAKAKKILSGTDLDLETKNNAINNFKEYFTWKRVISDVAEIFVKIDSKKGFLDQNNLLIFVDVTNAVKDPANSGVIRVTRRLCRELQNHAQVQFVVWDPTSQQYFFPTDSEFNQLSQFNGPVLTQKCRKSPDGFKLSLSEFLKNNRYFDKWLVFSETIDELRGKETRRFARAEGLRLAAIFYDAIPVFYPEFCKDGAIRDNHSNYMNGLAECDVAIPISEYSSQCLQNYWKGQNIMGFSVISNLLPGEFGGFERSQVDLNLKLDAINIICVSTLEPRKNHRKLIQACLLLQKEHPEVNWTLTLVGNRYAGAFDIAEEIQKISKENPRIRWLGIVPDSKLHELYSSASFTVYPSIVEGFGMPILESIWHGRPCICYREGVMAELAKEGGCLTTDVLDVQALSESIYRLATDRELLFELSKQAVSRKLKTWDEYACEFISILRSKKEIASIHSTERESTQVEGGVGWEEILYPDCLCENWQMNHSERLALTGLLSRHKPRCSIEIGTYMGGSLSLISQYSHTAFSIDIDPSIPDKFRRFSNVSFLTGPSTIILPLLLKELDREQIPVDFILIDGDHSAEGIKKDLDSVLSYVPKKPLFVVMHDSFNPECRRGMKEVNWEASPYVHLVDLDFIPGRMIEVDGPSQGELWGGLGLAYLNPVIRQDPLQVSHSASGMQEIIQEKSKHA
ncbi:MAG: glycosyltransferase [Methanomicrobiaceae archaeon]|nr:glycosyltransferase [Methanomicrobiaceae archaeon]